MVKRKPSEETRKEETTELVAETPVVTLGSNSKLSAADKVRWLEQNKQGGK